ncbi:MAG TPA: TAT-variant-translocated molybdopterin oxidoreductase [Thermoanaerobaculia bacterium]|nr:TAT-variant-translocated molybdopterin oxidoreductase [Thermoanaerobaculia bacterium]
MNDSKGKCGAEASPQAGPVQLDLAELRETLRQKRGPEVWRSLEELAETPEFEELLHREFPRQASELTLAGVDGVSRRGFLQLAGASLALAGLTGCTKQPREAIVPYVKQPEYIIPGRPLFFATALTHMGYAQGVLAESHMGRPTKIEGNPEHPANLGATDVFAQAAVLTLYDPERSQSLLHNGRIATWGAFVADLGNRLRALQGLGGEGVRILTGNVTSPTFAAQMRDLLTRFPGARWHQWESAGNHHGRAAAQSAFGQPLETRYDFNAARVVVAIDSDVLTMGPGNVRYQRDFARNRRVRKDNLQMSRLYAVESVPTNTGTLADHRLPLPPAEVEAFTLALAQAVGAVPGGGDVLTDARARTFVQAIAQDLRANAGASIVAADEYASPAVQVLVHAINQALGNSGRTVFHTAPVEAQPMDQVASMRQLVADMNAGRVELLLMLGGVNPVYTAPADLNFAQALQKVPLRAHHGLFEDETSEYCHWHVPAAHELESWGDARSFDGTVSVIQPLIQPLYNGKTGHEIVAALFASRADANSYELVREHWQTLLVAGSGSTFEEAWRKVLHDGVVPATQLPPTGASVNGGAVQQAASQITASLQQARSQGNPQGNKITLRLRPDPTVWDGSLAQNVWLQELPKPLTKLTWDNALMIGPAAAERLGIAHEETVEVSWNGRKVQAAAWVQPGMAEGAAALSLGYGRRRAGRATGLGFNAYELRTSQALWNLAGAEIRGLGGRFDFASTQNHHVLPQGKRHSGMAADGKGEIPLAGSEAERRHLVMTRTVEEFRRDPETIKKSREEPEPDESLYPRWKYNGHAWGMAIDLNVCTGCSSCVIACQSENNIPVVGKEQVRRGREMHWIRVDRYYAGDMDDPRIHNQPIPCMHCEQAPCEVVCPVAATAHSDEGLNDMVYNRCVGTRYCSNNCPYKVRRFNFFRYSDKDTPVLAMLQNPDVTVRMRGVMEKCTYCVQRIEQAKIESKVDGKPIPPNSLQSACQQACPTQAIVFGDINDPEWEVTKWKSDPLNYGLLEMLNTRPRTTYLAKITNPNPALPDPNAAAGEERTQHGHD